MLSYQQSVKLQPSSANTLLNMAIILHTKGHYEAAIINCRRAISTEPTYFAAYANMGILYQRNGEIDKAIETYREAIDLKPDFAPAYFNLGTAFESAGNCVSLIYCWYLISMSVPGEISSAIEKYIQAVSLHGDPQSANPKFHGRLATALVEAGHLHRNVSLAFDVSRHCRPIGSVCKHEKTCLGTSSRELDPSFYLNVGMVYVDAYSNLEPIENLLLWAESVFRLALARAGGNFHAALFGLGVVYEVLGKSDAAAASYENALKRRPDSGLYSHALHRLQRPLRSDEQTINKYTEQGIYARVDDSVQVVLDRYGCYSRFLTPLRVLKRMARSQEHTMSYIAVTINPLPPLLSLPPHTSLISDTISEVYLHGGWNGSLISSSAKDLNAYRKHFERNNISNVSFIYADGNIEEFVSTFYGRLRGEKSLDLLRLDNYSCSCNLLGSLLNSTAIQDVLAPKLVMLQVVVSS